jgi:urease accessory protein
MQEPILKASRYSPAFEGHWDDEVHLTFAQREKSRCRATTCQGHGIGWILPRGTVLADGDALLCETREVVLVRAASEALAEAISDDPLLLLRAAYHLGNRHVGIQVLPGALRFSRDHVLEAMVEGLGLEIRAVDDAFSPEAGAYGAHGHGHAHD